MDGTRVTTSQTEAFDERKPAIRVGGRHVADRALTLHPVGQLFPRIDPANPIKYGTLLSYSISPYNNNPLQFCIKDSISKHMIAYSSAG